jgi:hypothetical protein
VADSRERKRVTESNDDDVLPGHSHRYGSGIGGRR